MPEQITTSKESTPVDYTITPMQSSDDLPVLGTVPVGARAYFTGSNGFNTDKTRFAAHKNRKTGFSNIDAFQRSLYPGLYVLGAISSLGKTTFVHQMVEQMAIAGEHVLYFSLEQSEFELFSKSIARRLRQMRQYSTNGQAPLYSSIDIRNGEADNDPVLQQAISDYVNDIDNRLMVISTMFSIDVEGIMKTVDAYIKATGIKPIVVIDYLQIVTPSVIGNRMLDTRQAVDHIVHSLKCFQADNELSVILISSLNRQNYMTPIDFESFKESGGIEYTADVIWGLQLAIMESNEFLNLKDKIILKRDVIKEEKKRHWRRIEFVCVKNRYGISNYTANFEYLAQCDYFLEHIGLFDFKDNQTIKMLYTTTKSDDKASTSSTSTTTAEDKSDKDTTEKKTRARKANRTK